MCANPEHHSDEDCENERMSTLGVISNADDNELASLLATASFAFIAIHAKMGAVTPFMENYMTLLNAFAERIGDDDLLDISREVTSEFHAALVVFEAEYEAWQASKDLGEGA